jgi:hypothetical protein
VVGTVASVQSSIEFKKVALQLEVVPLINSEKEVSLDILQKIDSVVPGSNVNIGGNQVPTIATRYIRTNVSAPNCSTIVLGGLISDTKNTSKDGIPYLSRLPIVGSLFRNTTKMHDRTELIILMRPEVSLTKLDLYRLRQKHEDRTHFGPRRATRPSRFRRISTAARGRRRCSTRGRWTNSGSSKRSGIFSRCRSSRSTRRRSSGDPVAPAEPVRFQHHILPIETKEKTVVLATYDLFNSVGRQLASQLLKRPTEWVLVPRGQILRAMKTFTASARRRSTKS